MKNQTLQSKFWQRCRSLPVFTSLVILASSGFNFSSHALSDIDFLSDGAVKSSTITINFSGPNSALSKVSDVSDERAEACLGPEEGEADDKLTCEQNYAQTAFRIRIDTDQHLDPGQFDALTEIIRIFLTRTLKELSREKRQENSYSDRDIRDFMARKNFADKKL